MSGVRLADAVARLADEERSALAAARRATAEPGTLARALARGMDFGAAVRAEAENVRGFFAKVVAGEPVPADDRAGVAAHRRGLAFRIDGRWVLPREFHWFPEVPLPGDRSLMAGLRAFADDELKRVAALLGLDGAAPAAMLAADLEERALREAARAFPDLTAEERAVLEDVLGRGGDLTISEFNRLHPVTGFRSSVPPFAPADLLGLTAVRRPPSVVQRLFRQAFLLATARPTGTRPMVERVFVPAELRDALEGARGRRRRAEAATVWTALRADGSGATVPARDAFLEDLRSSVLLEAAGVRGDAGAALLVVPRAVRALLGPVAEGLGLVRGGEVPDDARAFFALGAAAAWERVLDAAFPPGVAGLLPVARRALFDLLREFGAGWFQDAGLAAALRLDARYADALRRAGGDADDEAGTIALVTGRLHALGLLDAAGPRADAPDRHRLSALGEAVLAGAPPAMPAAAGPALTVQANLEVIAAPGAPFPALLELARFAEPRSLGRAVVFALTDDSLARGLARGATPAALADFLRGHGGGALPSTVERRLQDLEERRGEATLRPASALLTARDPLVLEALVRKPELRALVLESLGERGVVLKPGVDLDAARALIRKLGLYVE
jgi:hypothetical protein